MTLNSKINLIAENVIKRISLKESEDKSVEYINKLASEWGLDHPYTIILKYLKGKGWEEDLTKYESDEEHDLNSLFTDRSHKEDRDILVVTVDGRPEEFVVVALDKHNIPTSVIKHLIDSITVDTGNTSIDISIKNKIEDLAWDIVVPYLDKSSGDENVVNYFIEYFSKKYNLTPLETDDDYWVFLQN